VVVCGIGQSGNGNADATLGFVSYGKRRAGDDSSCFHARIPHGPGDDANNAMVHFGRFVQPAAPTSPFCDGSVPLLLFDGLRYWPALATRAGGEAFVAAGLRD